MKLEKEIHQKKFKSQEQKLAINLLFTSNWLNDHYSAFFKEHDLSVQQFNVLRILRGQHPEVSSLKLVKERMLDRSSDASRIVDKLVLKKHVERNQCPDDRRSVSLLITGKGLSLLEKLDFIDDEVSKIFSKLTKSEIRQINTLLDKMRGGEDD